MKPFDLEKALAGEPVVTRDGRPVKIAGYNPDADDYAKIVGWVDGDTKSWDSNGEYFIAKSNTDLFMAEKPKVKKEGWVNVYPDDDVFMYPSLEEAEDAKGSKRVACIKIEWEEEA